MKPIALTTLLLLPFLLLQAPNSHAGNEVLRAMEGRLVEYRDGKLSQSNATLKDKKYVVLYYSAHWCAPCRAVTPDLVKSYNELKKDYGDTFEWVFISSDSSENDMANYMEWGEMTWPALDYSMREDSGVARYGAQGIPYLVVLDETGREVLGKGSDSWVHPSQILDRFEELLKKT